MTLRQPYWLVSRSCVKMLFKPATRKRLMCLVSAFLICIAVNAGNHLVNAAQAGRRCQLLLTNPAFKLYFIRCRNARDLQRFLVRERRRLTAIGAGVIGRSFVYQNQLYLPVAGSPTTPSLAPVRQLFGPNPQRFFRSPDPPADQGPVQLKAVYFPRGRLPSSDLVRLDLQDITSLLQKDLSGRRLLMANEKRQHLVRILAAESAGRYQARSPFFSRIESVVPMEYLDLWYNWSTDRTTDIVDWQGGLQIDDAGTVTVAAGYLTPPPAMDGRPGYWQFDIYPRYIPVWLPDIVTIQKQGIVLTGLRLQPEALALLKASQAEGRFLLSFEKLHVLESSVQQINRDRWIQNVAFFSLDFVMGVVFAFMMSLFAFVHLKAELAFLLMHRNAARSILRTFWLLPVILIGAVKLGALAAFILSGMPAPPGGLTEIWQPMSAALIATAVVCWPLNRWCFRQLTANRIALYRFHRDG
jgi:hypothetical protein